MGIQVFDASNNPVATTDVVASPDQQVADKEGRLVNPAKQDTLTIIQSNTANLDTPISSLGTQTTLATLATEATLAAIKAQTDQLSFVGTNLQVTGGTGAVLGTPQSVISTANSSVIPLGAGATFTGTAEDVSNYATVSVFVHSDQVSATDGLVVEWSSNGTNYDSSDTFTISPTGTKLFTFGPAIRYVRIRYTNGATPQGVFRLQTIFHPFYTKPSSHRIGESISGENDAELVKSVLTGKDVTTGNYQNVNVSDGKLLVNVVSDPSTPPSALIISDLVAANKVYTVSFNVNQPSAGVDNPLLLLRNPSGSGKTLYLYRVQLGINVANVFSNFRVFSGPTVTANGTAQTARSNNIGGGAPTASILPTSTPTISVSGGLMNTYVSGQNTNSIDSFQDFSVHVQENNALLLTGNPSSNNREATISVTWVEV